MIEQRKAPKLMARAVSMIIVGQMAEALLSGGGDRLERGGISAILVEAGFGPRSVQSFGPLAALVASSQKRRAAR